MFIKLQKPRRGFTIIEMMISAVLFTIVIGVALSVYLFSSRTFAVLANFARLDQYNRVALDTMTREIRAAQIVTANTPTSLTFVNEYTNSVTYSFDSNSRDLLRIENGSGVSVLLTNVDLLTFTVGQRCLTNDTWDSYPPVTNAPGSIKEVQLTWKAGCTVPGTFNEVSEDIQTAKIVLRMAGGNQTQQYWTNQY